ncbi:MULTISPECIES: FAD-dependent oxidoreductase [Brenneria]|uniref:FAD-binding protein n=1 Tax=Brenneria nigrifluens DSM 30175 = ATCC 13028 TaxID=1121120 RepID=A0A2U1UR35_9GAMM|nr:MULTISPECIES: FAD-dependent oxidoreductase [Brenneria]EHD22221.1 Succinate dehydrogenase [Brenneria sp. EniD312]PWC24052.1 FAD-binding protein [Brenneria nigrifluens] [Brenneria nigrifluens DSM 30175 = ATCC 13028]QCR05245.1 FAD-dependent oxidoreductase [Brenneria nigrifluens DSM 30175 = ATCC 13028]
MKLFRPKIFMVLCISVFGFSLCTAQVKDASITVGKGAAVIKKTDVVVIGAGAAGSAAAMAAAEKGAGVIILEKQAAVGGTGNFAEGFFAADSSMQLRQGILVTPDMAFKNIMDYSHWKANPYVVRAFVDRSADTFEWIKAKGVEFEFVGPGIPGGPMTWHVVKGPKTGRGRSVITAFFNKLKKMENVEILMKTSGKTLITDNGKVTGVMAEDSAGNIIRIDAASVVIATGGYANNKKMLREFIGDVDLSFAAPAGKDGDGLNMAWSAGAGKEGLGVLHGHRPGVAGASIGNHAGAAANQPYLWVDRNGDRFTNEANTIMWPHAGNALVKAGNLMFTVYDEVTRNHLIKEGNDVAIGDFIPVRTPLVNLDADFEKLAQKDIPLAFKADTLDALAKLMSVDVDRLRSTVAEYNQFSANRKDRLFNKESAFLHPIKTPPFYALKSVSQALGTLGGIKIDGKMRAVTQDGTVIPGLYAAGDDAGGLYGDTYDLNIAGETFGFGLNSGRIAGENAAKNAQSAIDGA